MGKEWFCKISGKQFGPFTAAELRKLASQGKLKPEHQVKQGAEGLWIKAEALTDLFAETDSAWSTSEPTPSTPPEPARHHAPTARPADERDEDTAGGVKPSLPAKHERIPRQRVVAEDPLEAIAASAVALPHSAERSTGKHHGKKADNSTLFVIVPVSLAAALVAAVFIYMTWIRADSGPSYKLDALARKAKEQSEPDPAPNPFADKTPAEKPPLFDLAPSAPGPRAEESKPRVDDGKWYDASQEAAWCGDATVKLISAEIAAPKVISGKGQESRGKEAMLLLTLEVRNNSKDRKLQYTSWSVGGDAMKTVTLVDNRSRPSVPKFKVAFPGFLLDGQLTKAAIDADGSIEDVLAFQQPRMDANLKYLRLQLPASAFGEKGFVRLEIPSSMISGKTADAKTPAGTPALPGEKPGSRSNPKSDFGIDGGMDSSDVPAPAEGVKPTQPPTDVSPGASGADPDASQADDAIGGPNDELKVDDSDLIRKKAQREAKEQAAAEEEAKKAPKKKGGRSANAAEELFKRNN